jgi:hypothetical protein
MARQFVTEQKGGSGLGVGVQGTGANLRFSHGGRDEGFDAFLMAGAETGDGVAIMINAKRQLTDGRPHPGVHRTGVGILRRSDDTGTGRNGFGAHRSAPARQIRGLLRGAETTWLPWR